MSKVLIDRELLERTATHLEWDGSEPMTTIQFAQKCDGLADELRRAIAQPAEAQGVEVVAYATPNEDGHWQMLFFDEKEAMLYTDDGQPAPLVLRSAHIAALSSVTAERDRLREEVTEFDDLLDKLSGLLRQVAIELRGPEPELTRYGYADIPLRVKTVIDERDQLRAEVERYVPLHEAVQRAAGELPEGWAIQLYIERDGGGVELIGPDGMKDFATNNERLDYTVIDALEAAMAAKEE